MDPNKHIKITGFLFFFSIFIFGKFHFLDFAIQDLFYDFNKKVWIFDEYQRLWKFVFYDLIRLLFHIFIFVFLMVCLVFRKKSFIKDNERNILIFFLAVSIILFITTMLKEYTNIACPLNTIRYKDGGIPIVAVWEKYPVDYILPKKQHCWPAGHATIGFVFLSLYFLFNKRKYKIAGVIFGLVFGWTIGLYKMSFGDHFFSHTWITMLLSWLVTLVVAKYIDKLRRFTKVMMFLVFIGIIGHFYTMFCSYTKPYRCSFRRIMFIQDSFQRAKESLNN